MEVKRATIGKTRREQITIDCKSCDDRLDLVRANEGGLLAWCGQYDSMFAAFILLGQPCYDGDERGGNGFVRRTSCCFFVSASEGLHFPSYPGLPRPDNAASRLDRLSHCWPGTKWQFVFQIRAIFIDRPASQPSTMCNATPPSHRSQPYRGFAFSWHTNSVEVASDEVSAGARTIPSLPSKISIPVRRVIRATSITVSCSDLAPHRFPFHCSAHWPTVPLQCA